MISHWYSAVGVPFWLVLTVLILAAWFVRRIYQAGDATGPCRYLWLLRFAAIAMTIFALLDLTQRQSYVNHSELVLVIDDSKSISLPIDESSESLSRLQSIKTILSQVDSKESGQLAGAFDLQMYRLGARLSKIDFDPIAPGKALDSLRSEEMQSRLGEGIREILDRQSGRETAAIVLFSDGAVTGGASLDQAGQQAGVMGVPVFTVGLGSLVAPPNIRVSDMTYNSRTRAGDLLTVTVTLSSESMDGQQCRVALLDKDSGDVLARETIAFTSSTFQRTIPLHIQLEQPGSHTLVVECESDAGETTLADNVLEKPVQVVDGKTKVLIVQDYPSPEYRFLKEALLRSIDPVSKEKAFVVRTLLQQASVGYEKTDATAIARFPSASELARYDLVILGDVRTDPTGKQRGLTQGDFENIDQYIRTQAGNLAVIAGPIHWQELVREEAFTRLLPFSIDRLSSSHQVDPGSVFDFDLLPAARSFGPTRLLEGDPVTGVPAIRERIAIHQVFSPPVTNTGSIVLAAFSKRSSDLALSDSSANSRPAITLQRIRRGTVVCHFTNELYRIRFRSGSDPFQSYWVQLLTDLAAERLQKRDQVALLSTGSDTYSTGETVELTAEVLDQDLIGNQPDRLSVLLSSGANPPVSITLFRDGNLEADTRFRAKLDNLAAGSYRVFLPNVSSEIEVVDVIETAFEITDTTSEMTQQNQQATALQRLAANSGGQYFDFADINRLWEALPQATRTSTGVSRDIAIWSWWFVPSLFGLMVSGLLAIEWLLRRRLRIE